ncbi:translation initiation factor IF-2, partial [Candidatus Woesearchaeota archaeon CG10_big_fil_rev_8_21_14_0_10_34_8]
IYDGILRKGDTIVIGHPGEPITTKIKALLEPEPLAEMRDKKSSFKQVPQVVAATGVKIIAPDIETVIPGMPFCATDPKEVDQAKELLKREVDDILIETDNQGIIIKADTLGSLEALIFLLREAKIPIRKASIGDITKKDIVDAESNIERDPLQAVILGFNINNHNDSGSVKIIIHDVIYKLIEDLQTWKASEMKKQEEKEIDILVRPGKIELMKGYVFRQNNPAVCGCHIVAGCVKAGVHIMKDGANISQVKSMQKEKESVNLAHRGEELAIAFESITIGRQVQEGDILYVAIPEDHFKKLKNLKRLLKPDEVECMKEVAQIMRQQNPVWGI